MIWYAETIPKMWGCHSEGMISFDFQRDLGTCKSKLWNDLSGLVVQWCCNRHDMYSGARPCKPLKTMIKTLYWTLKWTGSQCKEARTREMLDHSLCLSTVWQLQPWEQVSRQPQIQQVAIIQSGWNKSMNDSLHVLKRQKCLQFSDAL